MLTAGYKIEQEFLRIPSTKNLALIGRDREFEVDEKETLRVLEQIVSEVVFVARISDKEKEEIRRSKVKDVI